MGAKFYRLLFLTASFAYADGAKNLPQVEMNALGCCQGVLAPCPPTKYGGYVEADFLYWLPQEEGLEYAFKQNSSSSTPAGDEEDPLLLAATVGGHFNRIHFDWQPAFRLEAGYRLPLDNWDIFARYTRLSGQSRGQAEIDSISTQSLTAIWLGAEFFSAGFLRALHANASWNLHYNVLDGGIGRTLHWGSSLVLTPQAGIRGFWVNQRLSVHYAGGDITSPAYFKGINNFDGAGIFGQLNTKWSFLKDWALIGEFLGSLNFGRLRLSQRTLSQIQFTNVAPLRDVVDEIIHRTRFAYQAAIGFEWSHFFRNWGEKRLAFSAMYELCEWLHINQLRRFVYSDAGSIANFIPLEGTLGFQGISIKGSFAY